ncbi:MAG: hypothetical protein GY855_08605 [candidate division Zixibacteria bacterium]|nr:hypothetical protein [candidate division Zixibacteria bacterium]
MANNEFLNKVLERTERLKKEGKTPLAIFDLDGTLFTYTLRVRNILLDALEGKEKEFPGAKTLIEHIPHTEYEYLVLDTIKKYDIDIPGLNDYILEFWERWFFANKYLKYDQPVPGGVDFVNAISESGIYIIYLTGRDIPRMGEGTIASIKNTGYPFGDGKAEIILKPKYEDDNWEHKNKSVERIKQMGEVALAIDNEPGEVNILADKFPDAIVVMVHTLHSPGAPEPRDSVLHIKNFNDGFIE